MGKIDAYSKSTDNADFNALLDWYDLQNYYAFREVFPSFHWRYHVEKGNNTLASMANHFYPFCLID